MMQKLGLTKADIAKLEAFEMRVWQKMEKVSWADKVINVEVLQKVQKNRLF